jgi:26S proteasome regulatory subunit N2
MEVDTPAADAGVEESKGNTEGEEKAEKKEEEEAPPEPEPTSFTLENPARVTTAQEPLVSFDLSQRYVPVRRGAKPVGIVVLVDKTPGEPEDVADVESPPLEGDEDEAEAPEPFEWSPN